MKIRKILLTQKLCMFLLVPTVVATGNLASGENRVDPDGTGAIDVVDTEFSLIPLINTPLYSNPLPEGFSAGRLVIGRTGAGELRIDNGSSIESRIGIISGDTSTGNGVVEVTGTDGLFASQWNNPEALVVGQTGNGVLNINDSGIVNAGDAVIGVLSNSEGTVNINGGSLDIGGTFIVGQSDLILVVGFRGVGTLNIVEGAASSGALSLGGDSMGEGRIVVDGENSFLNSETTVVGELGAGALVIRNGGRVRNGTSRTDLIVADQPGSVGAVDLSAGGILNTADSTLGKQIEADGAVTVSGFGTIWESRDDLRVGDRGFGTALIENGGLLAAEGADIGNQSTGVGEVAISGALSSWTNTNSVFVGKQGFGEVSVFDAGRVTSPKAFIGLAQGSEGIVSVDGTGSVWGNTDEFVVGALGQGKLTISSGGQVTVGDQLIIAREAGSAGEVIVDGTGTRLETVSRISVGEEGTGTITVSNGAIVESTANAIRLGNTGTNSSGTVTLTEDSQLIANSNHIQVGYEGIGELNIADQAQLVGKDDLWIANQAGSSGVIYQSGGSITLGSPAALGDFVIGGGGTGTFKMTGGTLVASGGLTLGSQATGNGTMIVEGSGTRVEATGARIGNIGDASLEIASGGEVYVDGNISLSRIGSNSDVTIRGGARLTSSDFDIHVAYSGSSTATVTDNGLIDAGDDLFLALNENSHANLTVTNGQITAGNRIRASAGINTTSSLTITGASAVVDVRNSISLGIQGATTATIGGGAQVDSGGSLILGESVGGSATLTVQDASTGITVGGDLVVGNEDGASGQVSLFGGNLTAQGNANIRSGGMVTVDGGDLEVGGIVTPSGTGELRIDAGGLRADVIDVTQGAFAFNGGGVESRQFIGDLSHTNGIFKTNQFDGDLMLDGGTLVISDVPSQEALGTMTVDGDLSHTAGAAFFDLAGTLTGEFDTLHATGLITLEENDSRLVISSIDGFEVSIGDVFEIITSVGGVSGEFSRLRSNNTDFYGNLEFELLYDTNSVSLVAVPILDGDFDADGDVDGGDFLVWQRDPNIGELADWHTNFGQSLPQTVAASATVPEPATLWVLIAILVSCPKLIAPVGTTRGHG